MVIHPEVYLMPPNRRTLCASVPSSRLQAGFTLAELMVTVAVIAIVGGIAAPKMMGFTQGSRLSSQANELSMAIQLARSEAIRLNTPVLVCGTDAAGVCKNDSDWANWAVRTSGEVLQRGGIPAALKVKATGFPVTFSSNGMAKKSSGALASGAVVNVCIASSDVGNNNRAITFAGPGRTEISRSNTGGVCQ